MRTTTAAAANDEDERVGASAQYFLSIYLLTTLNTFHLRQDRLHNDDERASVQGTLANSFILIIPTNQPNPFSTRRGGLCLLVVLNFLSHCSKTNGGWSFAPNVSPPPLVLSNGRCLCPPLLSLYIIFNFIKYINFYEETWSEPGPDLDRTFWTRSEADRVQVQVLVDRTSRFGFAVHEICPDLTRR